MSTLPNPPRLRAPRSARAGEPIEIRALIEHPMETGLRHAGGTAVPRNLINRLVVRVNDQVAMEAELRNGTAANPYHVFWLRLSRTSDVELVYTDEAGRTGRVAARITIS
jgi:sulfur-oxidizing protein SoxZ